MTIASVPYSMGQLAFGETPSELDQGVPSAFSRLLENPEARFIYLVELQPYDETAALSASGDGPIGAQAIAEVDGVTASGNTITLYASDAGYYTNASDTPPHTSYLPICLNPYQFDVSILEGDEFRGGLPSYGAVRLLNGDGELDGYTEYFFGGRSVEVLVGAEDFTRADFATVFSGIMGQPEFLDDEVIISIQDKTQLLEAEFQQNLYNGTGSTEGGDDLEGAPKPLTYGECKNVPLVLVDAANLIYQFHDGPAQAVTAVYDKGVALTDEGDVSDITAASVTAGHYKTQLSGGYIKLGSSPSGRVTADVKGDNTGGVYIDTAGDIVERLVTTRMGTRSLSTDEIDQGALNSIDTAIPHSVGIYIDRRTNMRRVLDALLTPLHVWWSFDREGILTAGVIDEPSSPTLTIDEDSILDGGIKIVNIIPPAWRITLGHTKNYTVQTADDLAAGATNAQKTFAQEVYRRVVDESGTTRAKTATAVERQFNTLLVSEANALTEMERIKNIYRTKRRVFEVQCVQLLFRVSIGDVVNLETEKFGLSSGQAFLVTGISEDAETGITILRLWG